MAGSIGPANIFIYPVPQNAPCVSAGMNILNSPRGECPKATDVSPWYGVYFAILWCFLGLVLLVSAVEADAAERKAILFLGNSLTAGYGLDRDQAFPALIQEKIDSLGWNFEVINAGQGGDTTAGGLRRLDWLLSRKVHVLVLELGVNDGLRGVAPKATRQNLQAIIERTKEHNSNVSVVLAGMQLPPNLGEGYASQFKAIFPDLAKKNGAFFIPFLLEGVGGVEEFNLADGIHRDVEGHKIVAENVWEVMEPILRSMK